MTDGEERIKVVLDLMLRGLNYEDDDDPERKSGRAGESGVCHQVMEIRSRRFHFVNRCCHYHGTDDEVDNDEESADSDSQHDARSFMGACRFLNGETLCISYYISDI